MSREMTIIVLGVWVAIVPYLGFPSSWRTVLLVLTGLGIATTGFLLRARVVKRGTENNNNRFFVDNGHEEHHPDHGHKETINSLN